MNREYDFPDLFARTLDQRIHLGHINVPSADIADVRALAAITLRIFVCLTQPRHISPSISNNGQQSKPNLKEVSYMTLVH